MKLLATLLLASVAFLPCAAARVGHKAFSQSSEKLKDPHKDPHKTILHDKIEQRVIGGEAVEPGEFPFYVKWLGEYLCGGSLIHEDIILTAAHCQEETADSVSIGAYFLESFDEKAETRQIQTRIVHPDYNDETIMNDVMVLKITSPSLLPTIPLNNDSASPSDSKDVTVIGLGVTDYETDTVADALRKLTIQTVAHEQCATDSWADLVPTATVDEDVMLCAGVKEGDKASCNGDSGGPLLEMRSGQYVQVGIVSWGIEGCALPNAPGVYTRVSGVKDWIDQMICELSENPPTSCGSTPTPPSPPECEDVPGWYDSVGPEYAPACCFCDGGNGGTTPTPPNPTDCEDIPGWYDSDGPEYDRAWYEEYDACAFASGYDNDGYTAAKACCFCGGGTA